MTLKKSAVGEILLMQETDGSLSQPLSEQVMLSALGKDKRFIYNTGRLDRVYGHVLLADT